MAADHENTEDVVLASGDHHFEDLNYYITYEVYEYRLEVKAYRVHKVWTSDGKQPMTASGKPFLCDLCNGPSETVEDATMQFRGHVKWDGCSNWDFEPSDEAMVHFCKRDEFAKFGEVLARIWDMAAKKVPHWN